MYGINSGVGLYLPGKGHTHLGPGTSFVQRINWTQQQENQMEGLGLGCAGCGGNCGRCGLGLFDSGVDLSGWGIAEWAVVGIGGYALLSTVFTTQRATRRVRKSFKRYARRASAA